MTENELRKLVGVIVNEEMKEVRKKIEDRIIKELVREVFPNSLSLIEFPDIN